MPAPSHLIVIATSAGGVPALVQLGNLWQANEGRVLRFRCHTGHARRRKATLAHHIKPRDKALRFRGSSAEPACALHNGNGSISCRCKPIQVNRIFSGYPFACTQPR
ncbi:hypothetical protein [Hymenobacter rubidus]|uniref:hypothetical protein n=1 Tax=Hymenobacter rubidus TaxID=1441626 RepID=UPI00191E8399|nr:hypothetical protein [Hymenobacter rubidus]